jgi:hypothetical protein
LNGTNLVRPVVLSVAASLFFGCNSRWFRSASAIAREEAAYASLRAALFRVGVKSADHVVDAVMLAVEKKDYGGASGAFVRALDEHNFRAAEKLTSAQVIGYLRLAEPGVRKFSPRVGNGLSSFCDYLARR